MDKIIIKDLEVDAHIGVTEAERASAQKLLITVELERDLTAAGQTDMENSTTRYDLVADMVRSTVAERPRKLVEAVAHEIAALLLARKMADAVTINIKKFSVPQSRYVAVQIHRAR